MSEHPYREPGSARGDTTARPGQRPLGPTIILLAIGLWTGNHEQGPAPAPTAPAQITIVDPTDSAQVSAPLEITFTTTAPLRLTPMGWQAGQLHLHAVIDGAEIMPGALDIRALGDARFRWRLKDVAAGTHDVRLVWARPDHRAIPEGASGDVTVEVK